MNPDSLSVILRRVDRGAIKAFADVTLKTAIGDFTLLGFRVVEQPGKEAWVGFPQASYVKDGQTVNKPVLDVTRSQEDLIKNAVLAQYRRAPADVPVAPLSSRKAG